MSTPKPEHYRVELSATGQPVCQCENCQMWTITYDDGEPVEIGTSWQGESGQESAEDVCDLMNMAFDAGRESPIGADAPLFMRAVLLGVARWQFFSGSTDSGEVCAEGLRFTVPMKDGIPKLYPELRDRLTRLIELKRSWP